MTTVVSRFLPIPFLTAAREATGRIRQYSTQSLDRYRRLASKDPDNVQPTLFTRLFMEEDKLTFDEIRNDAQTYIVAGSDTTSNTMTYLVWNVCKRPAMRDDLVAEVEATT
jgi:cytochrome P450